MWRTFNGHSRVKWFVSRRLNHYHHHHHPSFQRYKTRERLTNEERNLGTLSTGNTRIKYFRFSRGKTIKRVDRFDLSTSWATDRKNDFVWTVITFRSLLKKKKKSKRIRSIFVAFPYSVHGGCVFCNIRIAVTGSPEHCRRVRIVCTVFRH